MDKVEIPFVQNFVLKELKAIEDKIVIENGKVGTYDIEQYRAD